MQGPAVARRPPFGANPSVGERGSDTRQRILDAALAVFADVGFDEARVELITAAAGCSRPAFYQYFSSKDDVFWALATQLGHKMVDLGRALEPITADVDGVAALARWIGDFATLHEAYSPVFSAFQAASRNREPLAQRSSTISDRLADALLRAFDIEGGAGDEADRTLATGVVAVLIRCWFYFEGMETVERARLVDGLAQIVHRLFAGPIEGVNLLRAAPAPALPPEPPAVAASDQPGRASLRTRGQQTRQRLLDAGTEVLPARGYHDARVDDIVEAAGVSHGSFYRYFENKEDFFRVLAEDASSTMIELLATFPADGDPALLRRWLDDWFASYRSNGGVISTWQEMHASDPGLLAFSQQVAASVVARLMVILDARGFGDPLVDALTLLAVVERLPYSVFTLGFTKEEDAIAAMLTMFRRGFLGIDDDPWR